jgi:hypothetical protein
MDELFSQTWTVVAPAWTDQTGCLRNKPSLRRFFYRFMDETLYCDSISLDHIKSCVETVFSERDLKLESFGLARIPGIQVPYRLRRRATLE